MSEHLLEHINHFACSRTERRPTWDVMRAYLWFLSNRWYVNRNSPTSLMLQLLFLFALDCPLRWILLATKHQTTSENRRAANLFRFSLLTVLFFQALWEQCKSFHLTWKVNASVFLTVGEKRQKTPSWEDFAFYLSCLYIDPKTLILFIVSSDSLLWSGLHKASSTMCFAAE